MISLQPVVGGTICSPELRPGSSLAFGIRYFVRDVSAFPCPWSRELDNRHAVAQGSGLDPSFAVAMTLPLRDLPAHRVLIPGTLRAAPARSLPSMRPTDPHGNHAYLSTSSHSGTGRSFLAPGFPELFVREERRCTSSDVRGFPLIVIPRARSNELAPERTRNGFAKRILPTPEFRRSTESGLSCRVAVLH